MIKYARSRGLYLHIYETQQMVRVWYREFGIYVIQNGSTLLQKNEAMSFPLRATQNAILWISLDLNINK